MIRAKIRGENGRVGLTIMVGGAHPTGLWFSSDDNWTFRVTQRLIGFNRWRKGQVVDFATRSVFLSTVKITMTGRMGIAHRNGDGDPYPLKITVEIQQ